jgi:uncharacterized protein
VNRLFILAISAIALIVLSMSALVFLTQGKGPVTVHASQVDLVCGNGTVLPMGVEVADTPAEWEHGLMNRSSMPGDAGMLFVFGNDAPRYFWMENTLIPLDMIFIAANLTIIDIHENATPLSLDVIASSGPCRYVLEVNGGLCAADDVAIGDRVTLDID